MNRWILAIADDLTGALEVGAKFSGLGLSARVTTSLVVKEKPDVPVLVIDTETRHLTPCEAASVVRQVASTANGHSPWLIYKKTDSTLRGNIAAELRALQEVFVERGLLYAPAYPEMGRIVKQGKLLVHGTLVHESPFAADLLNPVCESDIGALLNGISATVLDGECAADVQAAARQVTAAAIPPVAAGPAGLAAAIAENVTPAVPDCRRMPVIPRCLIVSGSLHPSSQAQIAFARAHHCFDDQWRCFDAQAEGSGIERATQTGKLVRQALESERRDGIVVFGGDTAIGIHLALGSPDFESYCEIAPGVPLSRSGGLFWITKAGGFGAQEILCDIRRRLT